MKITNRTATNFINFLKLFRSGPIYLRDFRVIRDVPVRIGFDTEAFNILLPKLEQNIVACLPKNRNIQAVQRASWCALILDTKPEYTQYIYEELFKSSKSDISKLPNQGSFFVPLSTVVVRCL